MKKTAFIIIFLSLCLTSCNKTKSYKNKLQVHHEKLEPSEITVKKYNEELFSIDTADFLQGIKSMKDDYSIFLGDGFDNDDALKYLKAFVTDTFCIRINDMASKRFSDTRNLENEIKAVYQRLHYYYPDIRIPETYFYVSGIDYGIPSIMIQQDGILIALDYYLGNDSKIYDYVGMPRYRSIRCQPSYITRDLAQSLYSIHFEKNNQKDVLSEMINKGKELYFIEAMNPSLADSVLLGYSHKQMQWAKQHEGDIWSTIVSNNMLYANDINVFRSLFGDGPFTQAFSQEAPARLGEFIGLHIIRSYMTYNDVNLQDMIRNNDIQQIFQDSRYKPKS